jgi:flagellar basal body-associated protein FliL
MEQKVFIITGIALFVLVFVALVVIPRLTGNKDDFQDRVKKAKSEQPANPDSRVKEKQDGM